MSRSSPVIVVGGGWAGLSAAVELARHDVPVILLESAKQLGGRARRIAFSNGARVNHNNDTEFTNSKIPVDNGQHLLVGAYESTLSLLRTIGVRESSVLLRKNMSLNMCCSNHQNVKITAGRLPAPLHLAWGLLFASGLSVKNRLRALQFCRALLKTNFTLANDESCLALLKRYRQTTKLIKTVWEPLCLAALNTPIDEASAMVFLRTLRETFMHSRAESDLLFTRTDLSSILPDPALDYIEKNGGSVRLAQRVTDIRIENNKILGVMLENTVLDSEHVILATPFSTTHKFTAPFATLSELNHQYRQLSTQPICTVYLQFPVNVRLGCEMVGLVNTTAQWIFDRVIYDQPGLMAVVISSAGKHMQMDNDTLIKQVQREISDFFPEWPVAEHSMIIREKRATFHCAVNSHLFRPANKTTVEGLWLAGDYTDTNLPATLESAVRSGLRSAHGVIESLTNQ